MTPVKSISKEDLGEKLKASPTCPGTLVFFRDASGTYYSGKNLRERQLTRTKILVIDLVEVARPQNNFVTELVS